MTLYKLTQSDKDGIIDYALSINGCTNNDINYILGFLEAYRYHAEYKLELYSKCPKIWTPAYNQALDKVARFFKYGEDLNNGPPIPN